MSHNPLEIPQQVRDLAEQNIDQARAAYGQFIDAMTQAMSFWTKTLPANDMSAGFRAVQDRATKFAKQNAEAAVALASDIASAKEIQESLAHQSRFAQSQMQAYALQAQELGRLVAEAVQSLQPRK